MANARADGVKYTKTDCLEGNAGMVHRYGTQVWIGSEYEKLIGSLTGTTMKCYLLIAIVLGSVCF